jgi:hypothetical protein
VIVEDNAQGWPTLATASDDDTRGRGLRIVEQLTQAWHVTPTGKGKRVTAQLA